MQKTGNIGFGRNAPCEFSASSLRSRANVAPVPRVRSLACSLTIHRNSPRIHLGIGERLQCMAPLMRRGCERGSQDCSAGREQVAEEGEQQKEEAYS